MMLSSAISKRQRNWLVYRMATLRANNVQYRRACETAIKGIRNADSMLSSVKGPASEVRAAQAQLRFALHATCHFIEQVASEEDA